MALFGRSGAATRQRGNALVQKRWAIFWAKRCERRGKARACEFIFEHGFLSVDAAALATFAASSHPVGRARGPNEPDVRVAE